MLGAILAAGIPALISAGGALGAAALSRGSSKNRPLETYSPFTQGQRSGLDQLLSQGLSGIGQNQFNFAPIAQQARTNFQTQTIPSLAERFSSLGGQGTKLGNSSFLGSLGAAGAGLEEGLAGLQSQYGLQQQDQLMRLLSLALTPQLEHFYRPQQQGFGQSFAPGFANLLQSFGTSLTPSINDYFNPAVKPGGK